MVGDWIKWVKGLASRPEVIAIARDLSLDRRIVPTLLMTFWEWCDDNCHPDKGTARAVDAAFVDQIVAQKGFAIAMQNAGWLTIGSDGIRVPRWSRHNGKSSKQRALHAEKMRRLRAARNGTKTSPEKRREEKRREEEIHRPDPVPGTGFKSLSDPVSLPAPGKAPGFTSRPDAGPGRKGPAGRPLPARCTDAKGALGDPAAVEAKRSGSLPVERFISLFLLKHAEAFGWTPDTLERQRKALTAVAVRMFQRGDRDEQVELSLALVREKRESGMRSPVRAWQAEMNRRYPKEPRAGPLAARGAAR